MSDMYSVLGWLLHFPIPLPVAVTTKQRTFCDPFLGGVPIRRKLLNLKQRVSLATFSSDHLAEQGIVQPIGWKHVFFSRVKSSYLKPTSAVGSNSTPNCGQMPISVFFELGSHWPHWFGENSTNGKVRWCDCISDAPAGLAENFCARKEGRKLPWLTYKGGHKPRLSKKTI